MAGTVDDEITEFRNRLLEWYYKHGRHFPWRNKSISNYQKIVAEVLLQRTKAETVAKFFPDFVTRFPSWKSIAEVGIEQLEQALQPIGLYKQRASRLHKLAVEMTKRGGRVPYDYEELGKIPMIGQYIANAAMSVVHDEPYPLLDVNMARVLERYFGPRKMADIRYDPYLQELAHKLVNEKDSKVINWAVLDFAAIVCKARKPKCTGLPLNSGCRFIRLL